MAVLIALAVIQALCDKKSKGDPNRWCAVEFFVGLVIAVVLVTAVGLIAAALYMFITSQF